ncbi:MAG: MFS transporter, partial [Dehalococcoidia bacterium]
EGHPAVPKLPAYRVFLIFSFGFGLFFAMLSTVSGAYQVRAGLNPLQLVLVGTALEGSTFVFQAPTGVLADVYSRRLSVVVGAALVGAGFVLWGASAAFVTMLIAQVIWALGYTFVSGAQEAWLADELGDERSGAAFLRGSQAGKLGALVGIVSSVALASVRLNLPLLIAGGGFFALALFMGACMQERNFVRGPREGRNSREQLWHTLGGGLRSVRTSPILISILTITAISGAASEGYDRLGVAHLVNDIGLPAIGRFDPVVWFAVISIGGLLLSLLGTEIVTRRLNTASHYAVAGLLAGLNLVLAGSVVLFALSGNFALAVSAGWAVVLFRRVSAPLNTIWINQNLRPEVRATVFSLASQADAVGQTAFGPLLGAIAAVFTVRAGIGISGLVLLSAMFLYVRTLRRPAGPEEVLPDTAAQGNKRPEESCDPSGFVSSAPCGTVDLPIISLPEGNCTQEESF